MTSLTHLAPGQLNRTLANRAEQISAVIEIEMQPLTLTLVRKLKRLQAARTWRQSFSIVAYYITK